MDAQGKQLRARREATSAAIDHLLADARRVEEMQRSCEEVEPLHELTGPILEILRNQEAILAYLGKENDEPRWSSLLDALVVYEAKRSAGSPSSVTVTLLGDDLATQLFHTVMERKRLRELHGQVELARGVTTVDEAKDDGPDWSSLIGSLNVHGIGRTAGDIPTVDVSLTGTEADIDEIYRSLVGKILDDNPRNDP